MNQHEGLLGGSHQVVITYTMDRYREEAKVGICCSLISGGQSGSAMRVTKNSTTRYDAMGFRKGSRETLPTFMKFGQI